jgi:ketosteroid isomerase-like protein
MDNNSISTELVRAAVARFWDAFETKSADQLEELYEPQATVWSSTGSRLEPGRLAVMRRRREYFGPRGNMVVSVKDIEIRLLGKVAVACYAFELSADRVVGAMAQVSKEEIPLGRATQVFMIDDASKLLIAHEHLSVAATKRKSP